VTNCEKRLGDGKKERKKERREENLYELNQVHAQWQAFVMNLQVLIPVSSFVMTATHSIVELSVKKVRCTVLEMM
jgi:hypothetical protein